jgi:hypothetical protein
MVVLNSTQILITFLNFVKNRKMNIQAEKLEIVKMILETDNPSLLESIKKLFKRADKTDFWDTLPQDQKVDILKGIEEVENGDVIDYEDFMKKYR